LINFAEANETKPEILPLRSNELDKQYEQLGRDTAQNIFIGHGVTSPMLFGVKSEGQLGGRSELDIAWQLFSLNYVEPRRKQFESEFNYLMQFTSVPNEELLTSVEGHHCDNPTGNSLSGSVRKFSNINFLYTTLRATAR